MPLFDFICPDCGREQEILIRGSENPACEACGGDKLARQLSLPIAHGGEAAPRTGGGPCGPSCGCH